MKPERVARDDAGFTLVELLVVVVLEAMIVTALGSAFVLVMNSSTTVKESLLRTNDARFAASYLVSDARNSSGPETSLSDTASCPDPNPPVSGSQTPVVRFNWNSTSSAGATTPNVVNYVRVANSLLRRYCRNGALVSDDALATNVASVSVACAPTANCSGSPTSITATITETPGSSAGAPYQYSVTGAFRKALAVGAPLPVPLSISGPASLPAWTVNRPYPSTTVTGTGGGGSYIWSASGLPAGLSINANTGVVNGTPTAAGAPTTITLNDTLSDTPATRQYTITINAAPSITTTSPLPNGYTGVAYSTTLAGSGGTAAYTWSATGLPAGLAINSSTGVISGTPTAAGTSTVAVTLTDAAGATATKNLSLTITGMTGQTRLTTNSSAPCTTGVSCATASVSTTNGATILILVHRGGSNTTTDAVASVTGPFTAATSVAAVEYETSAKKNYLFAYRATGNGGTGAVTVTFAPGSSANPTVVTVVQLSGNNTTTPIAQAPTNLATTGNASANLTTPALGNGEFVMVSFRKNAAITTPTGFTAVDTFTTGTNGGEDYGIYFRNDAQATTTVTSPDTTKGWGTIALEINHG